MRADQATFKILTAYTGVKSLDEALRQPQAQRLLWLEILVNDRLDSALNLEDGVVREAYQKACRWYTTYRSLIQSVLTRAPLPADPIPVDPRDYRVFVEALRFAANHP